MAVPPPPNPFDPLEEIWPAGKQIVRVHFASPGRGPRDFNPTDGAARFRPVRTKRGRIVSTMLGAENKDGAFSESIFHDVRRAPDGRRISYSRLVPRVRSTIEPTRALRLVMLHGYGLGRSNVRRRDLIDTGRSTYPATAAWGQAVYDHAEGYDGIVWMSRQFDSAKAIMLFGGRDRVRRSDLRERAGATLIPLAVGLGYDEVADAALRAKITIVRS